MGIRARAGARIGGPARAGGRAAGIWGGRRWARVCAGRGWEVRGGEGRKRGKRSGVGEAREIGVFSGGCDLPVYGVDAVDGVAVALLELE